MSIRERSGNFISSDSLVAFLYFLLRDHLSAGVIEDIMKNHIRDKNFAGDYSNGWIAQYAQDIASRLKG